jgi:hypothetical protein
MSSLRQPTRLGSSLLRPFLRSAPRTTISPFQNRHATQDYGSGDGNPVGKNPQDQGTSTATRNIEHPGADAPNTGSSSSSSSEGEAAQPQSSKTPSSSKDGSNEAGDSGAGDRQKKKETKGAQPKIHSQNNPDTESEDVKKHNEEMGNRYDKPKQQIPEEGRGGKGG